MELKKIAFFDAKPYDRESFDRLNNGWYEIKYFETRLTSAALPLPRNGRIGQVELPSSRQRPLPLT